MAATRPIGNHVLTDKYLDTYLHNLRARTGLMPVLLVLLLSACNSKETARWQITGTSNAGHFALGQGHD